MSLKMGDSRLRNEAPAESSQKKRAEPLKVEEEEVLWKKGFLGSGSPQTLVDTMVVMNGIYFALRSGGEHHQLQSDHARFSSLKMQEVVHSFSTLKTFRKIEQVV